MTADNRDKAIRDAVDWFNEAFSSHTPEHNAIVSSFVDSQSTNCDLKIRIECFNDISDYQTSVFTSFLAKSGYAVSELVRCRWVATYDVVYVGNDGIAA